MTSISENQQNLIPMHDSDVELNDSAGDVGDLGFHKNGHLDDIMPYSSTSSNSEGTLPGGSPLDSSFSTAHCNIAKAFSVFDSPSTSLPEESFNSGCTSTIENVNYSSNVFALPDNATNSPSANINMNPFLDLDGLTAVDPVQETSVDAPLKRIEDFVAKTMSVKSAARRNIRVMKSLKELNPETIRAMEEENERILQMETAETSSVASSSGPEIEIVTIEISGEKEALRSLVKPPPPFSGPSSFSRPSTSSVDDDSDIVDISPSGQNSGNDVIFVGNRDRYPSVSSFHCDDAENKADENGKILINVGRMKRDPCIFVADQLAPNLRPHQIGGIRFMFATLIESIAKFANTPGNGAVLAHSMGLGKTLQVITFLDAIFRCINIRSVLIVAPLNTMAHWMAEFGKWLPLENRPERLKVICIRDQKAVTRNALIKTWAVDGGVLLIGYEKLRAIVDRGKIDGCKKRGKKRKLAETEEKSMNSLNPEAATSSTSIPADNKVVGDDSDVEAAHLILEAGQIVICDEGHRIKSGDAAVTKVLKKVATRRRIILTGYPLQNNLMEYWCMIDFVRPFLLGNEAEFANLFKNPIENGQCKDSNERDRKIMRQRTYILQRTLCRIVQRRDSRPLIAELPKKREFALIFKQTPSQANLYRSLYEELTKHRDTLNAVALYTTFRNITHHPAIFFAHLNKLIENSNSGDSAESNIGPICQLLVNLVQQGKWQRFLTNLNSFKFDEIHSGKMLFLKHLIEESVLKLKEKIIIFSQSIDVLDYLQEYLPTMLPPVPPASDGQEPQFPQTFRIDGATTSCERERLINLFNDDAHRTQIFLISTEAGGIGINLTGGCRVVLMDVSWNPSKDIQAISRIYRYGQKNISSIYRLVGAGSMERCVFDRQTHKQFLFKRVVDDKSPILALNQADIGNLFQKETMCDPAEWHKCCEEAFPEEAKCDAVLQRLDSNAIFRQYLAEAPKIMDSILEADDTAQLSEYERREADANFLREKNPENGSGMRRGGRNSYAPFLPASNSQYRVPLAPQQQPGRRVWPSLPTGSMTRPTFPTATSLPEQVSIESVIRDAAVLNQLRLQAEGVDQNGSKGDILERYARQQGVSCGVRRLVPDQPGGIPSLAYVLHSPGSPVNFLFKPDGTVWRILNLANVASVAPPVLPPTLPARTPSLEAPVTNGNGYPDLVLR